MPCWPLLAFSCAVSLAAIPGSPSTVPARAFTQTPPAAPGAQAPDLDLPAIRALIDADKFLDADAAALRAITRIEAARGASDPEIAEAIDLVLLARRFSRRFTEAGTTTLGERALGIEEAAYGKEDARLANTLMLLGLAYSGNRDHARAKQAAERAVAIRERALPADDPGHAVALNALATVYRAAAQPALFEKAAERALAAARRSEQPAGEQTAAALSAFAIANRMQGRVERAVELSEEMLAIDERRRGPDNPANASSLLVLSNALWDLGDAERSRALHERAVRMWEATPGSDRRLAFEYLSLASKLANMGDYAEGFALAERGVKFSERTAGAESALTAAALDQTAEMQRLLGDHAGAEASRARAVEIWRTAQGPDSVHIANALNALAESFADAGQTDRALEVVERALAIEALSQQPAVYARVLQTHARLLSARDRRVEARAELEKARAVSESAPFATARTDLAVTLTQLARLDRAEHQPARALPLYRQAIDIFQRELGPTHIRTAEHRTEYAAALAEAGDLAQARTELAAGESASIDHLRLIARTLSDRRALEFAAERVSGVDLAVSLATHGAAPAGAARAGMARAGAPHAATDIDEGWQTVIRARTVVLDEMAARQRVIVSEANQAGVRDRWSAVTRARSRLANLVIRGGEGLSPEQYQSLVDRTRAERDEAERLLAQASLTFRQEQQRQRATPHEIVARLPPGAALVSYVRYTPQRIAIGPNGSNGAGERDDARSEIGRKAGGTDGVENTPTAPAAYAAFIARAGAPLRVVPLGPAEELDAAVAAWRTAIQAELKSAGLGSRRTETDYRAAGAALRARLWDPVRPGIGPASSVFIVPDGALHLVDFSTLPIGAAGYLVQENVTLHYILAERDLVQPAATQPTGRRLLAMGAADFDTINRAAADAATWQRPEPASPVATVASAATNDATHDPRMSALTRDAGAGCEAFAGRTFGALPATRDEMQHIATIWSRGATGAGAPAIDPAANPAATRDVVLLDGDRATEAAFKGLASGRRVLHLATHGFFLDRFCGEGATNGSAPMPTDAGPESTTAAAAAPASGSPATSRAPSPGPTAPSVATIISDSPARASTAAPGAGATGLASRQVAASFLEASPLLRSGLVLAGANRRASRGREEEDGILTAEEIAGLDLSATQWAVLSACDTGRGDWQAGEGIVGLRRAFLVAGARTVILSLWPVLDTVASDWMAELYRGKFVRDVTTGSAVRAASRSLLARRRAAGQSTHPLYWAGFVATGEWR